MKKDELPASGINLRALSLNKGGSEAAVKYSSSLARQGSQGGGVWVLAQYRLRAADQLVRD